MNCKEIRTELHQLADGSLENERANAISEHLVTCPLCRDEVAMLRSLRSDLGSLPRPELGLRTLSRLKKMVAAEFLPAYGYPSFQLIEGTTSWRQKWMMPTAVGTVATAILSVSLLSVILLPSNVPEPIVAEDENSLSGDPLYLANMNPILGDQFITPKQFALSRSDVSPESPSVNPDGNLVSMVDPHGSNNDDEVVVVAEVFRNGVARITNVVESSPDKKKMERLQAAFKQDRIAPPFVPANLDNRNDVVRVIMKFQNVNVNIDGDNTFR